MSQVSIKDIAREAKVSHSTVSRALSNSPLVSVETRARIQGMARDMGYSPDAQARSLVKGRTQTIGVVVTTISDPFVAEVVQGIESTAHGLGYSVILASSNNESERELDAVDMLRSKRVDGLIVTSSRVGAVYLRHLERIGVPIVLVNNHREEQGSYIFSISVDNQHGGCLATQHLIELGHRRIAFVGGSSDHSPSVGRHKGYREALQAHGLAHDPALVVPGNGRSDGGERALLRLLNLEDRPSAVFCYNDMTAIGLLRAAREESLEVPQDLAVVGFDDIPFASYVVPPLTTIAQPKVEMGQRAMKMVLDLIQASASGSGQVSNIVVRGQLIVRASSSKEAWPCKP